MAYLKAVLKVLLRVLQTASYLVVLTDHTKAVLTVVQKAAHLALVTAPRSAVHLGIGMKETVLMPAVQLVLHLVVQKVLCSAVR